MPRLTRHHAHWPEGVPHTLELPDRHLFSFLEDSARLAPNKTAIHYYGRTVAFRELHQASLNLAGYLQQQLDVQRGDRVLLLMQNCPQFAMAYYAILRCDAVVVAISPMSTAEEIGHYVSDSGARVLIASQELLVNARPLLDDDRLDACVASAPSDYAGPPQDMLFYEQPEFVREPRRQSEHRKIHEFIATLEADLTPSPMQYRGDDLAILGYTSGTTGKPKGAMLSHRNLMLASIQRSLWMPEGDNYISLSVLPVSHLAGMSLMNQAMLTTGTLVMLSRWDCGAVIDLIDRLRITSLGLVTPMIAEMFAHPDIDRRDLSSVRRIYGGAIAMPQALAAEIERRFAVPFIESYGMTESCGGTHVNPPNAPRRQCGGIPYINVDARVIDPDTGEELSTNQPGEIVTHSPTVFAGYWNRPDATRETFIELDGKPFLRTGDIGYHDEDGYFYVTDRLKRMVNAAGFKVWPAEIESMLYDHPAIQEACVISAYDTRRGETVKAFVILRPAARGTLTEDELIDWARTRMATYKVPRMVTFVDGLPKTSTGKTLWRELQRQQDEHDRTLREAVI
jgi:fatty-acyl-CoA synthase